MFLGKVWREIAKIYHVLDENNRWIRGIEHYLSTSDQITTEKLAMMSSEIKSLKDENAELKERVYLLEEAYYLEKA